MPSPQTIGSPPSPRQLFEASLPHIERIVGSAARRLALRPDEKDDFQSWVHIRLMEDDYRVLRKFGGRSSLTTYLTAVIQNYSRDYRVREWGRWRPSAAAERLGVEAVQLEILRERDGFSLTEAVEKLRSDYGARMSQVDLLDLAGRLPRRTRVRFDGGDGLDSVPSSTRASVKIEEEERRTTLLRAREVIQRSLGKLALTDRLVLKMHYENGLRISTIAQVLGLKQRELYTRRDRCVRQLRRDLGTGGLQASQVLEALGWKEVDFKLDFTPELLGEPDPDPSNGLEPKAEDYP